MGKKTKERSYKQGKQNIYCIICDKKTNLKDIEVEYNNKEMKLNGYCSKCGTKMTKVLIPINN